MYVHTSIEPNAVDPIYYVNLIIGKGLAKSDHAFAFIDGNPGNRNWHYTVGSQVSRVAKSGLVLQ